MYVVWGNGDPEAGAELRHRLLNVTAPSLFAGGARALTIDVHDVEAAQAPPPMPTPEDEESLAAIVSVWIDAYDRRAPFENALAELGHRFAGYLVVESVYDDYGTTEYAGPRDWPDGERSPGVLTVALIHRPEGLGYDEWIEAWHGTQSPLSAELQPRTRYVRNEVVRADHRRRARGERHRRGGVGVRRGRRRSDAVLQLRRRPEGDAGQRREDARQRERVPRSRPVPHRDDERVLRPQPLDEV